MQWLRLLVFALIFFYNPNSRADFVFSPSLFYKTYSEGDNGSSVDVTETYYDVNLDYLGASGLLLGGIYSHMSREQGSSETARTAYGVSIGYTDTSWFLRGHYFLSSEYEVGTNRKYTDGKGYQLDVGYWFQGFSKLKLGPQLTYRSLNYSKYNSQKADHTSTDLMPYFSLAIIF
jgi:hypothetical protein